MRVLVLGSTGFIGSHLVCAAVARHMDVVTLSRQARGRHAAVQGYTWELGQAVPKAACAGVHCAIHLAHDFDGAQGAQRTLESTVAIAAQLQAAGVPRQLFFSSYSSGEHASSIYGRTKFAIEKAIEHIPGVVIVRPGLVLGNGGLYGRIRKWARVLPVVPLPDGGSGTLPGIDIEKLCDLSLNLALSAAAPKEANLFEAELKSLRQLVLDAAAQCQRTPWILPIPARRLTALLLLAAKLHIRLPVNADNLVGFMSNQSAAHTSTLNTV
jgi:NADH dehydrogenase